MKKVLIVLACLLLGTIAGAQMKPQPKPATPPKSPLVVPGATGGGSPLSNFPRISQEDAIKLFKQNKATFVDVRSNEQYSYGHIKGALSIPRSQIIARFSEVAPGKTVITYCACSAEQSSGAAAANLIAHGVKNVFALKGGWNEWKAAGLPVAVGPK